MRFSAALREKLIASEAKYGWQNGWLQTDWANDLRRKIREHIEKGDPRDVAAYCAFAWYHGWSLAEAWQSPQEESNEVHMSSTPANSAGDMSTLQRETPQTKEAGQSPASSHHEWKTIRHKSEAALLRAEKRVGELEEALRQLGSDVHEVVMILSGPVTGKHQRDAILKCAAIKEKVSALLTLKKGMSDKLYNAGFAYLAARDAYLKAKQEFIALQRPAERK
jgi:hypothetical protein